MCGGAGAKGRVDCHERWEWLEDGKVHVQKLIGLIALCPRCHGATHYGRTQMMGYASDADEQLMKVNGWSEEELSDHLTAARDQWLERSAHDWKLDLDWLPATLGIIPGPPREIEVSAVAPTAETAVPVPGQPISTVGQLKEAEATLSRLQELLKQARYRVKYAEFWKTKITVPEAGEQRLTEAIAETKELSNSVRRQKNAVKRLAESLERERTRAKSLKRAQKAWPQFTRAEIELADEAAKSIGTTRARILRDFIPVTRQEQAAKRGMTTEAWVESSFALERFQDAMALREGRGDGPDVPFDEQTAADLEIILATPDPFEDGKGQ